MSTSPGLIFLSDDVFQLLVVRVPNEVLNGFEIQEFEAVIGTSRARYEFIMKALGEGGRTQGFVGLETAGYLRNALALTLLQLEAEFETRTGSNRDEALAIVQELTLRLVPAEVA